MYVDFIYAWLYMYVQGGVAILTIIYKLHLCNFSFTCIIA